MNGRISSPGSNADMTEAEGSPLLKGSTERTAFISYSWTSEEHRQWVLELANRLRSHGIDVLLDQWHLRPGQDKYAFMERMVTDSAVKKVIVICDRRYQEKADDRDGGVGDETLLITPDVYRSVSQEKFIPVVVERDENGQAYMPAYLRSRVYIDMSVPTQFDEKYQVLLRTLYGKPEATPPPLGTPPAYIKEEGTITSKAATAAAAAAPMRTGGVTAQTPTDLITTFFEAFISDLDEFRFEQVPDEPYDETMTKLIEQMGQLKNVFVEFAGRLAQIELTDADLDQLHDYLERIAQFQFPPTGIAQYDVRGWDNYRFICYEMVLYLTAALVAHGKYSNLARLVDSTYFYDSATKHQCHTGIDLFNNHLISLDEVRNTRLGLRRVSVTADMIKERTAGTGVRFDDLVSADLLLHYLTFLQVDATETSWQSHVWFPRLSPYATYYESIPLLQRLVSSRHFERVKMLLGVDTTNELRRAIEQAMAQKASYYNGMSVIEFSIPRLPSAVPLDRLASVP